MATALSPEATSKENDDPSDETVLGSSNGISGLNII